MKIPTVHKISSSQHENLKLPVVMKIPTLHKISNSHHENLDLSATMKILTVQKKILTMHNIFQLFIIKFRTFTIYFDCS